ncbi:MAG: hypothetical protein K2X01_10090 [Cyanobacteria bacterium]|nr:hypothetical protein [Cyanobacteriota bacterium]
MNHYFTEVSTQKAKALKTETQKIEATTAVANKKKRLLEACMTPFMQLAVGSVGVLTGILAAAAYTNSKEPAMVLKSQAVMRDSSWTFVQGIVSSVCLPVNLIKTAFAC